MARTHAATVVSDDSGGEGAARTPDGRLTPQNEAILVALAVALIYLILRTSPYLAAGAFSDDGVYLSLGKALSEGLGYRSIYAVGEPVHVKYPIGVPAVFAILWRLLPDLAAVHAAALWLSLGLTATTSGLLWYVARAQLGLSAWVAAAPVLGPFLLEGSVQYFNLPVSEPYFLFSWAMALFAFGEWRRRSARGPTDGAPAVDRGRRIAWVAMVGAAVAAAALFRTQAVVLVPAFALALFAHRCSRRELGLFGALAAGPVVAWTIWHRIRAAAGPLGTQADEMAYVEWVPEGGPLAMGGRLIEILVSQWSKYGTALPAHVASSRALGFTVIALFLSISVWGFARTRRDRPDLAWTVLLGTGVIALWPYAQDRFVLALLPFVGLLAAQALDDLKERSAGAVRIGLGVAVVAVVALVGLRQVDLRRAAYAERTADVLYFHPAQFLPDNTGFLAAASAWLAENGRPDDRPLTPLSSGLYLYTGVSGVNATPAEPSVGPSVFDEPGRFLARRVAEDGVNLLFLWNPNFLITRDAAVVQQACSDALEFLGMTEEHASVAVFRIRGHDPCLRERFLNVTSTVASTTTSEAAGF